MINKTLFEEQKDKRIAELEAENELYREALEFIKEKCPDCSEDGFICKT